MYRYSFLLTCSSTGAHVPPEERRPCAEAVYQRTTNPHNTELLPAGLPAHIQLHTRPRTEERERMKEREREIERERENEREKDREKEKRTI